MGEKASSHVHKSLEWESQELQPQFTELKPREGRQVTQQGKDPASPLLRDLPSAAGCQLDPSEVRRIIRISDGSPQGYLGEALKQQRSSCNGETRGCDRLGQVTEGDRWDKVGCLLPSSPSPLDLGVLLGKPASSCHPRQRDRGCSHKNDSHRGEGPPGSASPAESSLLCPLPPASFPRGPSSLAPAPPGLGVSGIREDDSTRAVWWDWPNPPQRVSRAQRRQWLSRVTQHVSRGPQAPIWPS